jgi:small subunit ribosomal protein S19
MAKKEFTYKGKKPEELKKLTPKEFAKITNSRVRRTIERGFTEAQKIFLEKLRKSPGKAIKTHCRDMVVLPEMIGRKILVYNGKEYKQIIVTAEMLGQYLGEFSFTRNKVNHSSPGVGATKSSSNVSVK